MGWVGINQGRYKDPKQALTPLLDQPLDCVKTVDPGHGRSTQTRDKMCRI